MVLYLDQVHMGGPDASFNERVHKLLTEEAGLNDKAADELAGYFDEMIGWNGAKKEPDHNYGPEIDRKKSTDDCPSISQHIMRVSAIASSLP